jgi:hypothetical protein
MIFWEGYKVLDLIFVPEFDIHLVSFLVFPSTLKNKCNGLCLFFFFFGRG